MNAQLFDTALHAGGVATLRIATDAAPYLDAAWVAGFAAALSRLDDDAAVRVIVLIGGERHFSAGASRASLGTAHGAGSLPAVLATANASEYAAAAAVRALVSTRLPVLAAAEGHALGGGLLLALWSDCAVLAEESLYGASFMALGITPGMGATYAVPAAFGEPLGRELLFTGRLLTGREIRAAACPLSHAVLPRARVLDHTLALARTIAEAPRAAVVMLRALLLERRREALERAIAAEAAAHASLFAMPDTAMAIDHRYPTALDEDAAP